MENSISCSRKSLQIVIATKNLHKIREIKTILLEMFPNIDLLSLIDFPNYIPPQENTNSFEENAITKATNCAKELNMWTIADDSGLVIPSLNGEPGVLSARYAGNDATDLENRKKLLSKIEVLSEKDRYAYFESSIALANPKILKKVVSSKVEGRVIDFERGSGGFGYDSIFIKHDYNKTFAELEESIKNKVSHRRKALDKLSFALEAL